MMTLEQQMQPFLDGLGIDHLPEEERQKIVELVAGRLQRVLINTLISLMTEDQKQQFSEALKSDTQVDEKIAEIVAQVPNAESLIQTALEHEYEVIKHTLAKE